MGGDGASGLAMAIVIAMVLLVAGAAVVIALLSRAFTRNMPPARRRIVMVVAAVLGAGIGWMAMMATFFESSWSPPPQLRIAAPAGFEAPVVILLQDRRARLGIETTGGWLPFTAATAVVSVPSSGIVRVNSFGGIGGRGDLDVVWPDGQHSFGAGGGPAPPGSGAEAYLIVAHPGPQAPEILQSSDPAVMAAYIAERERGVR